ncbi:hypothetical protein GUJ93_ZPchr0004g40019 [Zizania palustris]|uniref:Thioredoxin-like fold domain-containing protein n=1 Tax=Zizania palustris TaxID=103762 RepID=A0A8J5VFQ1_ZIZPA|nr:hypothetical protein GUJ93_ZPchr0004g40019 [Zizania palustris]
MLLHYTEIFGQEATKILDYVECFHNGAGKGKKMAPECAATGLEGFPTWIINGKVAWRKAEEEQKQISAIRES